MSKSRVILVAIFVGSLFSLLVIRGAFLQLIPNPQLESIKSKQFNRIVKLGSRRGDIFDRDGKELATSVTAYSLFADPKIIKDPYAAAKKLSRHFKVPFRSFYKKIRNKKRRFVWLRRRLDRRDYHKIKSWKIRGLAFKEESKRVYPNKSLASSVIGFVGREQQGLEGVEKKLEKQLSGAGAKFQVQRDARGRALIDDGRIFTSTPEGSDVFLTIDKDLQYWVEQQLKKAVKEHEAEAAWAVVLDPRDSAVLAMANYPQFDLNRSLKVPAKKRRNRVIQDVYETGSVMKAFTVGGALELGIVEPNTKINTENGLFKIGRRRIKEADKKHSFAELTVSEVLTYSSNVGTSKIALKMTDKKLYDTLLDFGFGEKTNVGLNGEERGLLYEPPWRDHLTANISFGHGVAVTALQVANAYAAIANGGTLHKPYIVKEVRDMSSGKIVQTPKEEIRRVLSPENANLLKMMLSTVVAEGGSGYRARIQGYPIAGKTGTAQKVNPEGRGYLPGHYISSFAGFVPANDPRYVIYVTVDSPKKKGYYATTVAAPVFREIAEFALRREGAAPVYFSDQDVLQQSVPEIEDQESLKQVLSLKDLKAGKKTFGSMPDLKGMTLREVLKNLQGAGLNIQIRGKGRVSRTSPQPGEKIKSSVRIDLKESSVH
ncbi:MAG: penicillin-binding protein [Pseudomonadota bacterium]